MAEQNAQAKTDAGNSTASEMVQIEKAELEGLKATQQFKASLDAKAKEILGEGYSADEYIQFVEEEANKKIAATETGTEKKTETKASETKTTVATSTEQSPELKKLMEKQEASERMSTTAYMTASHSKFLVSQSFLAPEDRSKRSMNDLLKVINGPKRALVANLAADDPQFEGNVFAVADYLLNDSSERAKRAKEAEDRNVALNKAKQTATVDTSTAGKTTDKKDEKSENDKAADAICPDDPPLVLA